MRNVKRIVIKYDEEYVSFGFSFPYFLTAVEGLHSADFELETEDNTGRAGATVCGSRQLPRPIAIEAVMRSDYTELREKLYRVLPEGEKINVCFYDESDRAKMIDAKVERIDIDPLGKQRNIRIELFCENPYFRAVSPTFYSMAYWEGGLEFELEFSDKNELEYRVAEQIKTLSNPSNVETPLKVTFRANGDVVLPKLENLTTKETMLIDVSMSIGDELTINTAPGIREKILINGKVANNRWQYGSKWLRLPIGDSVFRYDAQSGVDNLDVEIEAYTLYRGA